MNFLALLLGGLAVKQMTDYPAEIRDLRSKIPESDRDAVISQYKHLPGQSKTDFKQALRNADIVAASHILGQDLSKYNISLKKADAVAVQPAKTEEPAAPENIIDRVNRILAVPTDIDPDLVAEAAKRYEAAVPTRSDMSITEKTKRLTDVSG
ncbi:MAG: hypothetical protein P4N59_04395 [Negativicutes bacterium]|nr:hypothetical protein [Negativicutes bacterium]